MKCKWSNACNALCFRTICGCRVRVEMSSGEKRSRYRGPPPSWNRRPRDDYRRRSPPQRRRYSFSIRSPWTFSELDVLIVINWPVSEPNTASSEVGGVISIGVEFEENSILSWIWLICSTTKPSWHSACPDLFTGFVSQGSLDICFFPREKPHDL